MAKFQVNKSIQEINEKIKSGQAVVVTAEEMIDIVKKKGEVKAAQEVDVVTTGPLLLCVPQVLSLILALSARR